MQKDAMKMAGQAQEAGAHSKKVGGFVTCDTLQCLVTVSGQQLAEKVPLGRLSPLAWHGRDSLGVPRMHLFLSVFE